MPNTAMPKILLIQIYFLVNNNQDFDLTDATQWEVGIKAIWLDGKAESTVAYYDIERDDILRTILH